MMDYADLEIGLYRQDAESYAVELRFREPGDQAERPPLRGVARFDLEDLRQYALQPEAYGQRLSQSLFADPVVLGEFNQTRAVTERVGKHLRLRLYIDRSAPELHDLRWEMLYDPRDGSPLLTDELVLFSRFLATTDWRRVELRPKGELRALIAIANPQDLAERRIGERQFVAVDVAGELDRARLALGAIYRENDVLVRDPGASRYVTLENLVGALRGGYDILYLVCHGALLSHVEPPGPYLWLEKEDGNADPVPGAKLVEWLKDLSPSLRPRLIVLASCQSAGQGIDAASADEGALAALGPRLAQEAGIPAVLAMQGNVLMDTVARFMPKFFEELQEHGQVDLAMAVARSVVRDANERWIPVLFLRLLGGCIWYTPGFTADAQRPGYDRWGDLISSIRNHKCTPILGGGLTQYLFGSHRELAHRWGESEHYPLAHDGRDDLPQVAQYLATSQTPAYLRGKLLLHACRELIRRCSDDLPEEHCAVDVKPLSDLERAEHLNKLIAAVGARRRERDPLEPHKVLARLPFEVYITTNADDLLAEALRAEERDPVVEIFRWKESPPPSSIDEEQPTYRSPSSIYQEQPTYRPSVKQPLVYHLFGHLNEPESLVLTEDDHFDYLMRVNKPGLLPSVVEKAWGAYALLFIGFQMEDWDFRVVFRSILNEDRRERRREHKSVAVQITPEEGSLLPYRARLYLEEFFRDADMGIYWGRGEDFVGDLGRQWQDRGAGGG